MQNKAVENHINIPVWKSSTPRKTTNLEETYQQGKCRKGLHPMVSGKRKGVGQILQIIKNQEDRRSPIDNPSKKLSNMNNSEPLG